MAAVSDRCGIHFYAHPDPKIKKPVKCECMKHETTSSDHHYKPGGRVGSDAVFMTSDQLKKKRAFAKMFLPNYKNRYNMAIKSLNISEESCYKCCQGHHDEMKDSFAARNNKAQKTDKDGKDCYLTSGGMRAIKYKTYTKKNKELRRKFSSKKKRKGRRSWRFYGNKSKKRNRITRKRRSKSR